MMMAVYMLDICLFQMNSPNLCKLLVCNIAKIQSMSDLPVELGSMLVGDTPKKHVPIHTALDFEMEFIHESEFH